jgi:glycerol uptake facilitator-like aquaporin
MPTNLRSELLRTFWLVLGGSGAAVLAGAFPQYGIDSRQLDATMRWRRKSTSTTLPCSLLRIED